MKSKYANAILVALFCAMVGGSITESAFAYETSDWAARGQPLLERWQDEMKHYIPGAIVGAILGALLGFCAGDNFWSKCLKAFPSKELKGGYKWFTIFVGFVILLPLLHYVENGYVAVLIMGVVALILYYVFSNEYGEKSEEDDG